MAAKGCVDFVLSVTPMEAGMQQVGHVVLTNVSSERKERIDARGGMLHDGKKKKKTTIKMLKQVFVTCSEE